MNISNLKRDKDTVSFHYGLTREELIDQCKFLYSYFVGKLTVLRNSNTEYYISKNYAAEERYYKDMIATCSVFLANAKDDNILSEKDID